MSSPNLWTHRETLANIATAKADTDAPGFSERAADFLRRFASVSQPFLTEELIAAAAREGLTCENNAAWGSVVLAAKRRGEIVQTGFRIGANASPKPVWSRT